MTSLQKPAFIALLGTVLGAPCWLFAADGPSKGSSSLDDQLLKELDSSLLKGADAEPSEKPATNTAVPQPAKDKTERQPPDSKKNAGRNADSSSLDDELLGDVNGEDVGAASPQDPLVPIGRQMQSVKSRLSEQKLDEQTRRMQQKIVVDLAALLAECKKQCQGGGNGKAGSKPGKGGKSSQGGKSPAGQAPSDTARNSSDKLRDRTTERGDKGALVNAMKQSWGNLPEHARKHLANVNTDVFLPKYELMLEKYFKRLGEQDHDE